MTKPQPLEIGTPGTIYDDMIWTGNRWQKLHGRDLRNAFQTSNGFFWPLEARVDEVEPYDIAIGLGKECRYGSQTPDDWFYSVAWHSVALTHVVPEHLKKWALMHDAPEAYLSDVPRVLKRMPEFEFIRNAEVELMAVIAARFGMDTLVEPPELKPYDYEMSHTEMLVMYGDLGYAKLRALDFTEDYLEKVMENEDLIQQISPLDARDAWLEKFEELFPEWAVLQEL